MEVVMPKTHAGNGSAAKKPQAEKSQPTDHKSAHKVPEVKAGHTKPGPAHASPTAKP